MILFPMFLQIKFCLVPSATLRALIPFRLMLVGYVVVIYPLISEVLLTMQTFQFFSFTMVSEQMGNVFSIIICLKVTTFIFTLFPGNTLMHCSDVVYFCSFREECFGARRTVVHPSLVFHKYVVIHIISPLFSVGASWEGASYTPLFGWWLIS